MKSIHYCLECGETVAQGVHEFSQRIYGHTLCMMDQYIFEESGATAQAVDLYLALRNRDFPLMLEYFDGHKYINMALPGKLHIEVCGPHHESGAQGLKNLSRSVYSLEKNIPTIIIPLSLLNNPATFSHTVDELVKACRIMQKQSSVFSITQTITAAQLQ